MRRSNKSLVWVAALIFFVLCSRADAIQPLKTLTIAADLWCPINCDPNSSELGIGIDLAKKVFRKYGYNVNYVVMPWARALEKVKKGEIDAVIGATKADEPTLLFPENPICEIADDFYVLTESKWNYVDKDSLKRQHIGIIKGYGYNEIVTQFIKENSGNKSIEAAQGDDALVINIQKLLDKKIDVFIDSKIVVNYKLKKMDLANKIRWAGGIRLGFIYLAFSPALSESTERMRQYDEGIEKLKGRNELDIMYVPYGITP